MIPLLIVLLVTTSPRDLDTETTPSPFSPSQPVANGRTDVPVPYSHGLDVEDAGGEGGTGAQGVGGTSGSGVEGLPGTSGSGEPGGEVGGGGIGSTGSEPSSPLLTAVSVVGAILALAGVGTGIWWAAESASQRRAHAHSMALFTDRMVKLLRALPSTTLDDVATVANSVFRGQTYDRTALLEDCAAHMLDVGVDEAQQPTVEAVRVLLVESRREDPYAGLPDEQRRLLQSARAAFEHGDTMQANLSLDGLRNSLQVSNRAHARATRANKYAVPLAIVGVMLTVLFGVLGSWSALARLVHRPPIPASSKPTTGQSVARESLASPGKGDSR